MPINRRLGFVSLAAVSLLLVPGRWLVAEEPTAEAVGEWAKSLIRDGRLTVEFYDPARPPRAFPGWTELDYRLDYRYDYQVELPGTRRTARTAGAIVPTFTRVSFPVVHRIQLPGTLDSERWYLTGLGRHELDHVRVGMHPRLPMLAEHLVRKVQRIPIEAPPPADGVPAWVGEQVDARIRPRRDAIHALVREINRQVDARSNHGAAALPDREAFLDGLYLKENLDEMKFPYLADVLDLVNSREYRQARLVFQPSNGGQKPTSK